MRTILELGKIGSMEEHAQILEPTPAVFQKHFRGPDSRLIFLTVTYRAVLEAMFAMC